ncbi:MAG: 3-methyl-2-oxobutanoate hydroxymethyltransferase [Candidatus Margulisiibacteriota bacterium]
MKRVTPLGLSQKKAAGEKITMLTAYDVGMARILDESGIDILLVGDSVGQVFAGYPSTVAVTVDQILYHTQAVSRGTSRAMIVADMPFLSYEISPQEAARNAGRLIKEGGAHGVKMEVHHDRHIDTIRFLVETGIPVMGHIGFTPQNTVQLGGPRVQGRQPEEVERLLQTAQKVDGAGVFAMVIELVPGATAETLTAAVSAPTIGIGAGAGCSGQVLVTNDLLGLTPNFSAKFVKKYVHLHAEIQRAVMAYKADVESGEFPGNEHSF